MKIAKNKRILILCILLAAVLAVCLVLTIVLLFCNRGDTTDDPQNRPLFSDPYRTTARQGYETEYLGTTKRNVPTETKDGGLAAGYPTYGTVLPMTEEEKTALDKEAWSLCGKETLNANGVFDYFDKDGYLHTSDGELVRNDDGEARQLYKHTASNGMYRGDVSDDEPAVIKRITFSPRNPAANYNVTGLYAPAGELIKVVISEEDMLAANGLESSGGVVFHIGQCLYNGQNNNLWTARDYVRMPVIMSTLRFNAANSEYDAAAHIYTAYIGSFLGGPIYIRNLPVRVTLTFSGAVNYRHFILGFTTEAEFSELSKSSAPYFDLEIWERGVLHSGPLVYAKSFSYGELYDAAIFWEKVSLVSTQVSKQGIAFLYDPFIAAGAAVAFVGRSSVNCPPDWMTSALDLKPLTTSGAWGVLHEYNHNFQGGWGLENGGEVTNNALTLVSYAQFTQISANRTLTEKGFGGNSGWNTYTDGAWALKRVLKGAFTGTDQLSIYSTLLHQFGAENFIKAAKASGTTNYYRQLCTATGYDMTYFFRELLGLDPGDEAVSQIAAQDLPVFVPTATVYQTGRALVRNGSKYEITTERPYRIPYGKEFIFDLSRYTEDENGAYLSGSVVIPDGFSYRIKNVSAPEFGTLTQSGERFTYRPDPSRARSGKIHVTLELTAENTPYESDDIELILEFEQSHEIDGAVLERTVYTYEDGALYASAEEAYQNGYAGYKSVTDEDNVNPVQNANAEIWAPKELNSVMELRGKLYVPADGDYRIALRGRKSCALYLSRDGETYDFAAKLVNSTVNTFWEDPETYCDLHGLNEGDWIYFKAVLLVDYSSAFIGLGWGALEGDTAVLSYANAYRGSYRFPEPFTSDYLFKHHYSDSYEKTTHYPHKGTLILYEGYTPWQNAGYSDTLGELFDENDENFIHSAKGEQYDVTEAQPFSITVDLGEELYANTMTIYGEPSRQYQPKDFQLYGGTDLEHMTLLATVTGAKPVDNNVTASFTAQKIRYYKLICTATQVSGNPAGSKYIAFRGIGFCDRFVLENGVKLTPDDASISYRGNWTVQACSSVFGRVYIGTDGDEATFTVSGSRFALYSLPDETASVQIYVDGVFVETATCKQGNIIYLSDDLGEGTHTVKLVCVGNFNLEAITIY